MVGINKMNLFITEEGYYIRSSLIKSEILVCLKCNHPVKSLLDKFYSCNYCNSIVTNVKWIDNTCKS
jgi:hypothetical protein